MEFERVLELGQGCLQRTPTIILGSGASVPYGIPGMWPLGQHLRGSNLPSTCNAPEDVDTWRAFLDTVQREDLESALTHVHVTGQVLAHIVNTTWRYLNRADLQVFFRVVSDRRCMALTRLFEYLFNSTHQEIDVVTPNYDRIAEYAAEAAGYMAYTGFGFQCVAARATNPHPKVFAGGRQLRTVNVWKVHGSFGWFADNLGRLVSLPPLTDIPEELTPVIVTPGIEKYRRTHDEPFRSVMQRADDAVRQARAFICVGFGFNDPHLQPLITERCGSPDVPLVLITKQVSETAHSILKSGRYLRYLAIEECQGGSRIYANEFPDGVELIGPSLWSLDEFLNSMT